MMAVVILVFSLISLLLFFLSYCRSLVASSTKEALPQEVVDVTGITHPSSPDDFSRVMQLLRLCPDRPEERGKLRAITAYYRFLGLLRSTLAVIVPSLKAWTDNERRSEEHTSELQSHSDLVCRLLLEKKKTCIQALPSLVMLYVHMISSRLSMTEGVGRY